MKSNKRILSFFLAIIILFSTALPVSAYEIGAVQEIIDVTDGGDVVIDSVSVPDNSGASQEDEWETEDSDRQEDISGDNTGNGASLEEEQEDALEQELPAEDETDGLSLGQSGEGLEDKADLLAAMEEWLNSLRLVRLGGISLFSLPGDTGTVTHTTISINPYDVTVPGVGRAYGSVIWRMKIGGTDAFCLQIWKLAGGTYTAGDATSGNGATAQYIANFMASSKSNADYVATQVLVWESLYGDIGLHSAIIQGTSFQSAYNSIKNGSADASDLLYWTSSTGAQEIATFATGTPPDDDGEVDPPDDPEDGDEVPPTETVTTTSTRTEVRGSTDYEYSDAIGQITIAKRDDEGKSLDGAIFRIDIEFANGQRGGTGAFEVYNGSRLYTWTHPADDHEPAKVTVTEIYCPPDYVMDSTPKTAIVHPTYTRVTKVTTTTITITTTSTTTTNIETGEVLAQVEVDSETSLDPPMVQEYTDFIEGDRETTLTFVNMIKSAELIIFKYRTGVGTPLQGAQFEVSYVDPSVHSGRWTVTTGSDGKAVISLPKPGAILIHEVSPPAGHIISPISGPDTTVTILAGERKQVDIPNDPYTAVEVTKIDSVTGAKLAGATISLKHITSGMEFRQVTDANGIALFENVEPGSYYVEEIIAPDRYVLNTTRYPVQLRSNETATVTIPNDPYTGIEVTKVDANNGQKLAGAFIRLKHISTGQEYSGETGADGKVYFGLIPPGNYYVEEVQAPFGYVLNDTRYPLELKTGELATLTLPNYRKDGLYVRKVDENGKPIAGAVFELRRGSGEVLLRDTTDSNGLIYRGYLVTDTYVIEEIQAPVGYLLDENNPQSIYIDETNDNKEYVVTFVNKKKPSIQITKVDANTPTIKLQGAIFRISEQGGSKTWDITTGFDGTALLENLEISTTYVVEEIQAPTGYVNSGYKETIVLNECRVHTITVSNGMKPKLRIEKINEATGGRLPGAVFRVTKKGGAEYKDVTTGIDGTATVENLEAGWYEVTEIRAPSGYVLDSTPREIEVIPGETAVLSVNNSRKPTLTLRKIDEQSGNGLPGAVLRVSQGGISYQDVTTGADGVAVLSDMAPGWYTVTEIQAPSGYILDATPRYIQLKAGENAELVIQNQRKPTLTIVKIDDVTKQLLQYAKFRVSIKEGKTLGEYVTDENGEIFLDGLDPALYVIEEIQAPDGYIILSESKEIRVEWGTDVVVEFPNQPVNPLLIKKVDAKTGEPLPDAKFLVTKVNGEYVGEYTTGRNGYITVTGQLPGWFTIKEIKAPLGYILDDTPKQVELKLNQPAIVEFENQPLNGLHIKKIDSLTKEALTGAKFRVSEKGGSLIGEYTTDAQGEIIIDGLEPGWYTIEETAAPDGYVIDNTPKDVEFVWGQFTSVEFTNSRKAPLQIKKIDAKTGEALSGAKFRVTTIEGKYIGEYTTDRYGFASVDDLEAGWYVVTEITAPDGFALDNTPRNVEVKVNTPVILEVTNNRLSPLQIKKTDEETGAPLAGAYFRVTTTTGELIGEYSTGQDGFINVPELSPGSYIVSEIKCPDGYQLDNTPKTVVIKADSTALVEFTNKRLPGLQVRKVDANTNEPLSGAKFRLEKMNGERIGDFVTNSAGFFVVSDLDAGWYTVYETQAPAGYIKDSTAQNVELKPNKTAVVEFQNKPLAGLQIKKVDDVTGLPMAGVVFDIAELDGRRVGTFTTDDTGLVFVPGLNEGWLIVTETKTLSGYKLDSAPRNVEIKADRLNVLEYRNQPYPFLQIKKMDSETGKPIAGVKFKVYDKNTRELGEFSTNDLGIIKLTGMEPGTYYIKETQAAEGYVLDATVREVTVYWGKTTTVEVKNMPMATLRLKKIDSVTGKPLMGAGFILYDAKNNIVGEYTSDENGLIQFPRSLPAGQYKLKEIKSPDGYVLLDKPITITLKSGETQEIEIPNDPVRGKIQIVKKSADDNAITKKKAGAVLAGAVFEIVDENLNVVDTITTDSRGIATTIDLPLGKYVIQEITAPKYYVLDDSVFYGEIKLHGDVVRFEVLNTSSDIAVTVEKRGNVEALTGDLIRYDFSNISNASNISLNEFYWHDQLPTDAVRLEKLFTGTWSERLKYKVFYRTNLKTNYRVWKDNLLTTVNHELDVSDLKLAANEFITDFKLEFGTVEPGFHEVEAPFILTRVLDDLPHEYRFANKTDVGGKCGDEFIYNMDSWVTIAFSTPKGSLPRTGLTQNQSIICDVVMPEKLRGKRQI